MANDPRNRILDALSIALKPLAKLLLNFGIGYREFAEVAKFCFVDVATEEFGIRGRPTNISRVSVITGISRKEVSRMRSIQKTGEEVFISETPAARLLHAWSSEPKFLDSMGVPLELFYRDAEPSFVDLVRSNVGDVPPGAIRSELQRMGAVAETRSGKLRLVKRHFVPDDSGERAVMGLESISALGGTIASNCDPARVSAPRFQRLISVDHMPAQNLPVVSEEVAKRLQTLSEEFDDFLYKQIPQSKSITSREVDTQVGVGLFYYELPEDK